MLSDYQSARYQVYLQLLLFLRDAVYGRGPKNTFFSWQALSGSLINGAVYRSWYCGLGGDERVGKDKILGGLGYVLACVTTAPVAILIYACKNIPLVLGAVAALIVSPFVLMGKALALCFGAAAF